MNMIKTHVYSLKIVICRSTNWSTVKLPHPYQRKEVVNTIMPFKETNTLTSSVSRKLALEKISIIEKQNNHAKLIESFFLHRTTGRTGSLRWHMASMWWSIFFLPHLSQLWFSFSLLHNKGMGGKGTRTKEKKNKNKIRTGEKNQMP